MTIRPLDMKQQLIKVVPVSLGTLNEGGMEQGMRTDSDLVASAVIARQPDNPGVSQNL
jgi:hypothetical protein